MPRKNTGEKTCLRTESANEIWSLASRTGLMYAARSSAKVDDDDDDGGGDVGGTAVVVFVEFVWK